MTDGDTPSGTVLVCHPDGTMRTAYERMLADHRLTVHTAGRPADLPPLAEMSVRGVFLPPEAPGLSVDELHSGLEGTHGRVTLLVPFDESAPATDSLPGRVDGCLAEPVPDERLVATADALPARARYDARLRRCFELAREVAAMEADPDATPEGVRRLRTRLRRLRAELDDPDDGIGAADQFAMAAEPDP